MRIKSFLEYVIESEENLQRVRNDMMGKPAVPQISGMKDDPSSFLNPTPGMVGGAASRSISPSSSSSSKAPDYSNVMRASSAAHPKETPTYRYQTGKGSTYVHYGDNTSIRDKMARPEHPGESGIQPRSNKTIYMDRDSIDRVGPVHQNPGMRTSFIPHPTKPGHVALQHGEDYGPRKTGELVRGAEAPYSLTPKVGLHPVEVMDPHHHKGVHFGSPITHLQTTEK